MAETTLSVGHQVGIRSPVHNYGNKYVFRGIQCEHSEQPVKRGGLGVSDFYSNMTFSLCSFDCDSRHTDKKQMQVDRRQQKPELYYTYAN